MSHRTLYVGNLSADADHRDLKRLFSRAGQVLSVVVIRDDISGERSVAYVEMQSEDGATAAIARFNAFRYSGQTLMVSDMSGMSAGDHDI